MPKATGADTPAKPHMLTINDRKSAQLTGVKNVLTVPLSALGESAGDNRYKVKVLRNGESREREVVIGARNDTDVVVVKGLEEGEEVVTSETLPGAAQ